jgi:hypothetical protein
LSALEEKPALSVFQREYIIALVVVRILRDLQGKRSKESITEAGNDRRAILKQEEGYSREPRSKSRPNPKIVKRETRESISEEPAKAVYPKLEGGKQHSGWGCGFKKRRRGFHCSIQ